MLAERAPVGPGLSERDVDLSGAGTGFGSTGPSESAWSSVDIFDAYERRVVFADYVGRWARSQIRPLLDLPPDWDSYGGLPIDKQSADFATALLIYLGNRYVEPPSVVPTSKGGVSLEWYSPTLEVGFEVRPGPRGHPQLSIFYSNDATGVEWEDEYAEGAAPDERVDRILDELGGFRNP